MTTLLYSAAFFTFATGIIALVASKGRHYSWLVFLFIGGASLYAAVT